MAPVACAVCSAVIDEKYPVCGECKALFCYKCSVKATTWQTYQRDNIVYRCHECRRLKYRQLENPTGTVSSEANCRDSECPYKESCPNSEVINALKVKVDLLVELVVNLASKIDTVPNLVVENFRNLECSVNAPSVEASLTEVTSPEVNIDPRVAVLSLQAETNTSRVALAKANPNRVVRQRPPVISAARDCGDSSTDTEANHADFRLQTAARKKLIKQQQRRLLEVSHGTAAVSELPTAPIVDRPPRRKALFITRFRADVTVEQVRQHTVKWLKAGFTRPYFFYVFTHA